MIEGNRAKLILKNQINPRENYKTIFVGAPSNQQNIDNNFVLLSDKSVYLFDCNTPYNPELLATFNYHQIKDFKNRSTDQNWELIFSFIDSKDQIAIKCDLQQDESIPTISEDDINFIMSAIKNN